MEEHSSIGKRIAWLRKERGLTQDQLAERVGVTAQAVRKWENDNSCPDISILPRIAEVLGVSTDMLLGVSPVAERSAVGDKGGYAGSGQESEQEEEKHAREGVTVHFDLKKEGVGFALLVVLLGVAFLLSRLGVWPQFNFWSVVWPAVLLGLGVSWTLKRVSPVSVGVALLGLYYLLFHLGAVHFVLDWSLIWPIGLILVGLTILLEKLLPRRKKGSFRFSNEGGNMDFSDEEGFVRMDGSFCEDRRVFDQEEFCGGDIDVSFGRFVLDLTRCKTFRPGARLQVDVSFGACEILLPRCVSIMQNVERSFGSCAVKGQADADAAQQLAISGDVSFGSLEIRYC